MRLFDPSQGEGFLKFISGTEDLNFKNASIQNTASN